MGLFFMDLRIFFRVFIVVFTFTLMSHPAKAAALHKVLLLHSYHAGYKWTDDITSAVQNEIFGKDVDLRIEYLDTKRFFSPEYLLQQKEALARKYANTYFNAVLVSDNHALNFALDFRTALFPKSPIVFCGINSFTPQMLRGQKNITGINESVGVRKTVDLMLSIHPKTKRIIVVNDESVTATALKLSFKEETKGKYPQIDWLYTENYSTEDLLDLLHSLSADDLVLLGVFFRDNNGRQFEYYESAELISKNSPVAVYSLFDFYLNHGVIGGYLTNGALQGQVAAKLVLDILDGVAADSLPVIMKSPNQYFADFSVLQRFGIDENAFPQETIFINPQPQFYKEHRLAIWATVAVILALSFLTLLLSINVVKKKKAQASLNRLTLELKERVDIRTEELHLTNKEMKRKEEQMQHLLSNLSGMVYRCKSTPEWSMMYVSEGCYNLTKYLPDELLANTIISYGALIDPRDREKISRLVAEAINSKKHFTLEYRIRCKDDTIKWVWEQGLAVYDESGKCLYIDGIITDISERKIIEQEQTRLTTAVEQTDDLIIITDSNGNIEYANPAFERVTGYSLAEVKGHNPRILKSGKQSAEFYSALWNDLKQGKVWRGRFINRRKDGTHYIAEVTISPIRDGQGELINYIGVQRDITHETELEKNLRQAQKLEAMGTLAGGIAHEINTPAQFVSTNLDFIHDSLPDLASFISKTVEIAGKDKIKELFEQYDIDYLLEELPLAVQQSSEGITQISNIVRSMKQFAHPGEENMVNADINDSLKNTATVCRNEWKYCAEMSFDLDDQLPLVPCHRSEINQVFLNIIVNAAHAIASRNGENGEKGFIAISTRHKDSHVEIAISDNGGGIADEVRERIFDPFFTTKEPGKGTGQGLSIAHSIITEKHNGTIQVDTTPGKGSTFTIALPLSDAMSG
ncbi:PAS domain S-box protein [Desulforhopalus sp. IMCC35007]|nr:PAS domain S-box protein [Desulforhopalus sp. IMCC35007]